jgi:hypothetical protein
MKSASARTSRICIGLFTAVVKRECAAQWDGDASGCPLDSVSVARPFTRWTNCGSSLKRSSPPPSMVEATIYCVNVVAGLMITHLTVHLRDPPVERDIQLSLLASELSAGWFLYIPSPQPPFLAAAFSVRWREPCTWQWRSSRGSRHEDPPESKKAIGIRWPSRELPRVASLFLLFRGLLLGGFLLCHCQIPPCKRILMGALIREPIRQRF